jgi:hypothetical protein
MVHVDQVKRIGIGARRDAGLAGHRGHALSVVAVPAILPSPDAFSVPPAGRAKDVRDQAVEGATGFRSPV